MEITAEQIKAALERIKAMGEGYFPLWSDKKFDRFATLLSAELAADTEPRWAAEEVLAMFDKVELAVTEGKNYRTLMGSIKRTFRTILGGKG